MPYISNEQLETIKQIDVLSYLQRFYPSELVRVNDKTYCTKEHDSLKISNGKWYWWSRGFGGKNALDYIVGVEGKSFYEAASFLAENYANGFVPDRIPRSRNPPVQDKHLVLPEKADNNDVIISYLIRRGISRKVIDYCINKNLIYQSAHRNNLVFVGFNNSLEPKYASVRGTGTEKYFSEPHGSDKTYSFRITNPESSELHLFEGAIDLLSFASLLERRGCDFQKVNMISLGGINDCAYRLPESVGKYLSEYKTDCVYLHFDNDEPGKIAAENFIKLLEDRYKVINAAVPYGKDVNEYLQKKLREERAYER